MGISTTPPTAAPPTAAPSANPPKARDPNAEADMLRRVGLRAVIAEDYQHNRRSLLRPGFQALLSHRLGVYATTVRPPLRPLLSLVSRVGKVLCRNVYGIELERSVTVGRRLAIGHQHGIVIHRYATIGDDCIIRQGVTFGIGREYTPGRGPVIGDRVQFGVGSVVVGNVVIGDDVSIGPNCVVVRDVPPNSSLFVAPPRMIRTDTPGAQAPDAAGGPAGKA